MEELNQMVSTSSKQEKAKWNEERSIKMSDGGGKFAEVSSGGAKRRLLFSNLH